MLDTYNMREAQAQLTKLCRSNRQFVIANRNRPTFVAMPVETYETLIETLDVLANRQAVTELSGVHDEDRTYTALDLEDPDFGL